MNNDTTRGGCGCGGGSTQILTRAGSRKLGHIDSDGRCVCGECEPCNGLQCLCRPRFFDGQLLAAADLRRLDNYVVQKNRMHNKYLHGVGVVCGLEAVCNPCDDGVTVRTGYALGPCGEDIVVCDDTGVDVARLIKEQRSASARSDCPPYGEPVRESESARQKWVLGICYDERPARPVTGLKGTSGCGCGGSCGGNCGGGCGGSKKSTSPGSGSGGCGCGGSCSPRSTTASCEPTQLCEGYRFTLTKVAPGLPTRKPVRDPKAGSANAGYTEASAGTTGQLPALALACLDRLRTGLGQVPADASTAELVSYAADLKDQLRELIETGNIHDCTLGQRLSAIAVPDGRGRQAGSQARAAIGEMLQLAVDLFRECICSALLPHCADGCADDCVPLAVLTVRSSDLRVLEICNWSARKFAITMPMLQYWFGWIPIFSAVRDAIVRLCCVPERRPQFELADNLEVRPMMTRKASRTERPAAPPEGARTERPDSAFVGLLQQYKDTWSSLSGLEATVLGALGAQTTDGQPLASNLELDNPLAALALGRLGMGAAASVLPADLAERVTAERVGPVDEAAKGPDRLADLEASLATLKRKVDSQARTITTLKKGQQK